MARAARPCLSCGALSNNGTRCEGCTRGLQRRRDQQRGTSTERGYGASWQRLVADAISLQPWCTDCGTAGDPTNPLTGDHLRWPAETVADVAVCCRVCNSRRGAVRAASR